MLRITLLAALAATCFAQNAEELLNRPPEDVDKALRARVTEFYGYHVSGQFRKAEALVAEDTKDFFYASNKPNFLGCNIRQVKYSDEFTHANVMMMCKMVFLAPGFTDKPVEVPFASTWKIEEGKWVWYISQDARLQSPFGKMKPGDYPADGAQHPAGMPAIPTNADFLNNLVKPDKSEVEVKRGESVEISIVNNAPGPATLEISGNIPGIEAKLENPSLKASEKTTLTLKAGDLAASGTLQILVKPIQQIISIRVTVK